MPNTTVIPSDHLTQVRTETRTPIEAITVRVVWFVFGVIEVLIAVRFVLKLFGANVRAPFVELTYGMSAVPIMPFAKIFATTHASGSTIEWSSLVAIAIYALLAWGLVSLIRTLSPGSRVQTVQRVEVENDASRPR